MIGQVTMSGKETMSVVDKKLISQDSSIKYCHTIAYGRVERAGPKQTLLCPSMDFWTEAGYCSHTV